MTMPGPIGNKAGIITKPYGLQGGVNLILDPGIGKIIKRGIPLFISIDGQRVPFFIEEVEMVTQNHCIVKFEFINDVEEARKVTNCDVFLDPVLQNTYPSDMDTSLKDLIGYTAIDSKLGHIGTISEYIPQDFNPIFLIDHRGEEKMIPAQEPMIDRIDFPSRTVFFRLPDGLIDL